MRDMQRYFGLAQKRQVSREVRIDVPKSKIPEMADNVASPMHRLIAQERNRQVMDTLERMPDHYREILELRFWHGLTFVEIGQRLQKSSDAARQIWYNAIEHFAELIDESESR